MTTTHLFIDGGLPSLNNVIQAAKKHHMVYAKMKREHTGRIEELFLANDCVPDKPYDVIAVSFLYGETKKKRDPDNITVAAKFVLDAMVNVGMIEDDTRDHVVELNHDFTGAIQKERSVSVRWCGGWNTTEA